jgi:hypothetical protein
MWFCSTAGGRSRARRSLLIGSGDFAMREHSGWYLRSGRQTAGQWRRGRGQICFSLWVALRCLINWRGSYWRSRSTAPLPSWLVTRITRGTEHFVGSILSLVVVRVCR